jgi:hypothetical protein
VTAPRLQLKMYCSRVTPSPGRGTCLLISHMSCFFLPHGSPVVRADNIYVDHRRTISTTRLSSGPRQAGGANYVRRDRVQNFAFFFRYHGLIAQPSIVGAFLSDSDGGKICQSESEKRSFFPATDGVRADLVRENISKTSLTGITIESAPLDHKR